MVVAMAQKLIDDYQIDDPSKLVADIRQINEHWQTLLARLVFVCTSSILLVVFVML
jgi:hypothetical protein